MRGYTPWLTIALGFLLLAPTTVGAITGGPITSVERFVARFKQADGTIDHAGIYAELGIKSRLFEERPAGNIQAVSVGRHQLKLFKLSDVWRCSWQYLLFRKDSNGSWRFAGNIDFADQHYEEPGISLKSVDGQSWLVFRSITGYGTGFLIRKETWYPAESGTVRCVLSYLADAHFVTENSGAVRETDYTLTSTVTGATKGKPTVVVSHTIVRKVGRPGEGGKRSSAKEVKTRFAWSGDKRRFIVIKPLQDPLIVE